MIERLPGKGGKGALFFRTAADKKKRNVPKREKKDFRCSERVLKRYRGVGSSMKKKRTTVEKGRISGLLWKMEEGFLDERLVFKRGRGGG